MAVEKWQTGLLGPEMMPVIQMPHNLFQLWKKKFGWLYWEYFIFTMQNFSSNPIEEKSYNFPVIYSGISFVEQAVRIIALLNNTKHSKHNYFKKPLKTL